MMDRMTMVALAGTAWMVGCSKTADEGDIPPGEPTGMLMIHLSSATAMDQVDPRVSEVGVRVDQVEVQHEDEGWIDISEERMDLDLMGDGAIIGEGDVWVGAYDKVQIGIVDAWVVVDGVEEELRFTGDIDPLDPLAKNLMVNESFFVDEGSETTVDVRWNLGDNLEEQDGVWSLGAQTTADVEILPEGDL